MLAVGNAHAVIIGGGIISGPTGSIFQKLTVPFVAPVTGNSSVGKDTFNTPNLYAFNEDQNIVLGSTLMVDVGSNVASGQTVASHYVFFDPAGSTGLEGYVDFDATIIGVATSRTNLDASDLLQNNLVTYLSPSLRGLESGDKVTIGGTNNTRLSIDWRASTPGDYVRVFTQYSPMAAVPVPAALPLFVSALGFFGLIGWRRKRSAVA